MSNYIGTPMTRLAWAPKFEGVPTSTVRPHIEHLQSIGMQLQMIARAAGVTRPTVSNIIAERYPTVSTVVAGAILATTPTPMKHQALVLAYPTRRRLEGLAVRGWSLDSLQVETGLFPTGLSQFRQRPLIRWESHCMVRDFYERLCIRDGGSEKTKLWAEANGFVHPFDWDDLENFYEVPVKTKRESAVSAFWSEVEHFRGFGWDDARVAEAMNMTLMAFQQRLRRYPRQEVAA